MIVYMCDYVYWNSYLFIDAKKSSDPFLSLEIPEPVNNCIAHDCRRQLPLSKSLTNNCENSATGARSVFFPLTFSHELPGCRKVVN